MPLATHSYPPFVDLEVKPEQVERDILTIFRSFRPELSSADVAVQPLSGGLVNLTYRISVGDDVSVLRVFSTTNADRFDRQKELELLVFLQQFDLYEMIYGTFRNGFCSKFRRGRALAPEEVWYPQVSRLIAWKMAKLHATSLLYAENMDYPKTARLIEDNFARLPVKWPNDVILEKVNEFFPNLGALTEEFEKLCQHITQCRQSSPGNLVLCHNDLVAGNIIYDEDNEEVHFIDYEFAAFEYPEHDLAGLFLENEGRNGNETEKQHRQLDLIRTYLEARREQLSSIVQTGNIPSGAREASSVADSEVWNTYVLAWKLALLRPFFVVSWVLNSLLDSDNVADPESSLGYARSMLDMYHARKADIFALRVRNV